MTKIVGIAFEDISLTPHFYDFLDKIYPKKLVFGIGFEGNLYKQFPEFIKSHIDLIRAGRKKIVIPNCDYRVDEKTRREYVVEKGRNTVEVKETVIFNCDIDAFSNPLICNLFDTKLYIGSKCPDADLSLTRESAELALIEIIKLNSDVLSKLEVNVSEIR